MIMIPAGQVVGLARNPSSWLDKAGQFSESEKWDAEKRARLVQALIQRPSTVSDSTTLRKSSMYASKCLIQEISNPSRLRHVGEDPLAEPPIKSGPETAEMPEEIIPEVKLLQELDVSTNLFQDQVWKIQSILMKHKGVFGLDSRLGNYAEEVRN